VSPRPSALPVTPDFRLRLEPDGPRTGSARRYVPLDAGAHRLCLRPALPAHGAPAPEDVTFWNVEVRDADDRRLTPRLAPALFAYADWSAYWPHADSIGARAVPSEVVQVLFDALSLGVERWDALSRGGAPLPPGCAAPRHPGY
jgi:hypothetical protein